MLVLSRVGRGRAVLEDGEAIVPTCPTCRFRKTEMKIITQSEFDALPVVDGWRQCPWHTDYRNISIFGAWCRFGEGCSLEDKSLIGHTVFVAHGFGSLGRMALAIPATDGLWIRCGCRFGTISDFREWVHGTHGSNGISAEYLAMCDMFEARYARTKQR